MYPQEQFALGSTTPAAIVMQGGKVWYLRQPSRRLAGCLGCDRPNCSGCKRLGATVNQEVGQAAAQGSAATAGLLTAIGVSGPAAPIVAAVGGLIEVIASFFGKGCGQACIQSATLEQVPEVALQDLHKVASSQMGAISGGQFQQAWQSILSYGMQQLQQLEASGDKSAAGGITNLQKSTDYTSFVASLPEAPTVALDLSAAEAQFISPSASGWYPSSIAAGNALALQILQSIAANPPAGSGVASTVTAIESATGLSSTAIYAGLAVLAYFLFRGNQ